MEAEAGKTVPVLSQAQENLSWRVPRGGSHAPLLSPSSNGRPLGVLEVEVELAQLEVVEVDTEVKVFLHF